MNNEIWLIHGANATPVSFALIMREFEADERFKDAKLVTVSYDCQEPLLNTVESITSKLPTDRPISLVGHSLGGVLAVAISQRNKHFELGLDIQSVITYAAPMGGSEGADYLKWLFPHYHLFKNISTKNTLIKDIQAAGAAVPTLSLITTSGNNPVYPEANDGVVTLNSQRALPGAKRIEVAYNHFEVLVSQNVFDLTKNYILENSVV